MNIVLLIAIIAFVFLIIILSSIVYFHINPEYRIVEKEDDWFYVQYRLSYFEWKTTDKYTRTTTLESAHKVIDDLIRNNKAKKIKKVYGTKR